MQTMTEDKFEVQSCVPEAAIRVRNTKDPRLTLKITLSSLSMREERSPTEEGIDPSSPLPPMPYDKLLQVRVRHILPLHRLDSVQRTSEASVSHTHGCHKHGVNEEGGGVNKGRRRGPVHFAVLFTLHCAYASLCALRACYSPFPTLSATPRRLYRIRQPVTLLDQRRIYPKEVRELPRSMNEQQSSDDSRRLSSSLLLVSKRHSLRRSPLLVLAFTPSFHFDVGGGGGIVRVAGRGRHGVHGDVERLPRTCVNKGGHKSCTKGAMYKGGHASHTCSASHLRLTCFDKLSDALPSKVKGR